MRAKTERLLWFCRLKKTLNKFDQIHCEDTEFNTIIKGTRDYNALRVEFVIKLLSDRVILKLKNRKGIQDYCFPEWHCNAALANDILFLVIIGGTHIPR